MANKKRTQNKRNKRSGKKQRRRTAAKQRGGGIAYIFKVYSSNAETPYRNETFTTQRERETAFDNYKKNNSSRFTSEYITNTTIYNTEYILSIHETPFPEGQ
uniref:Uncharacterized protein n=1 Tax=viral metagenome TaxID=1070528 RepID=A0A6C0B7B5_9ZZZZ